jgi:hypothetical protein
MDIFPTRTKRKKIFATKTQRKFFIMIILVPSRLGGGEKQFYAIKSKKLNINGLK